MSIDQNLKTHLPTQNFFDIKGNLPTDKLFHGVTYQWQGKVWNIQVEWDNSITGKVQGIFIRIHSAETFYALHVKNITSPVREKALNKEYNKAVDAAVNAGKSAPKPPRFDVIKPDDELLFRTIQYDSHSSKPTTSDTNGLPSTSDQFLIDHLKGITLHKKSHVPKISPACKEAVEGFFSKEGEPSFDVDHPLIPDVLVGKPPAKDPAKDAKAKSNDETSSYMKWILPACLVIGFVLLVKLVRRPSKPSQPLVDIQPLKSSGTGAVT